MSTFAFNTTTVDLLFMGGSVDLPPGVWVQVDDSVAASGVFDYPVLQNLLLLVKQNEIPTAPPLSSTSSNVVLSGAPTGILPPFTMDNLNNVLVTNFGGLFTDPSVQTMLESLVTLVTTLNPGS